MVSCILAMDSRVIIREETLFLRGRVTAGGEIPFAHVRCDRTLS